MTSGNLKVIVVGSGLAGLTAARVLRVHHSVTVYEQGAKSVATGGQGIMIGPSSVKILDTVEFQRDLAGAVPIHDSRTFINGGMHEKPGTDYKIRFGQDALAIKRSDFRDELMRLATTDEGPGEPVTMIYEKKVTGLDCDKGIVELSDGATDSADVVIIADGVHSRLRNELLQSDTYSSKKTGLTCYRFAITTEAIRDALSDLALPYSWDPSTCRHRTSFVPSPDGSPRFVLAYPIRNGTMLNFSCIFRATASEKPEEDSWNAHGDKRKMHNEFEDFGEDIKRIMSAATEVKIWELQDLSSLPTWVRGRAILIGDAAHAMTPMQGQGANMSIEDAEAFRLLRSGVMREAVPEILNKIEGLRKKRVDKILEETRKAHEAKDVEARFKANEELYYGYEGILAAISKEEEGA